MVELIRIKSSEEISKVSKLAMEIMKEHYDPIVGSEVNDHMLKKFQSVEGITAEMEDGAEYYFVNANGEHVGFVAVQPKEDYLYLSKFYLAKRHRGKGYAKDMMAFVKDRAKSCNLDSIMLNVNADNAATVETYRHFKFEIVEEIWREVGEGYCVHDYVMQYKSI
ncbi:MAG: GNAT family N-acetyltransferase [Clostridia bacterium]|nr:GNAT family N-acetyltransferase [Clostridia bacterium]